MLDVTKIPAVRDAAANLTAATQVVEGSKASMDAAQAAKDSADQALADATSIFEASLDSVESAKDVLVQAFADAFGDLDA